MQLLQQADGPNVILLEGLMVLQVAAVRERSDLRLFVELDADERALRRMLRDMSGIRGIADPAGIATYYRECARVGHAQFVEPSRVYADLIVRGDADWERLRPLLLAVIDARLAHAAGRAERRLTAEHSARFDLPAPAQGIGDQDLVGWLEPDWQVVAGCEHADPAIAFACVQPPGCAPWL